jgi:hypothetical protein
MDEFRRLRVDYRPIDPANGIFAMSEMLVSARKARLGAKLTWAQEGAHCTGTGQLSR